MFLQRDVLWVKYDVDNALLYDHKNVAYIRKDTSHLRRRVNNTDRRHSARRSLSQVLRTFPSRSGHLWHDNEAFWSHACMMSRLAPDFTREKDTRRLLYLLLGPDIIKTWSGVWFKESRGKIIGSKGKKRSVYFHSYRINCRHNSIRIQRSSGEGNSYEKRKWFYEETNYFWKRNGIVCLTMTNQNLFYDINQQL